MKHAYVRVFFITAVLSALAAATAGQGIGDRNRPADGGNGSFGIQGRIILPNGRPAVGARAYISSPDVISGNISAVTNNDGVFQVGSLQAGNYTIVVQVSGMPAETERLTIDRFAQPGRTFNIVFNLRHEGSPASDDSAPESALLKGIPRDALDKFRKGQEKLQKNDGKGAIALFDEAIRSHSAFAAAYYEKGMAQMKEKDLDGALASFVKAIEIKQDYLEAKYSVGYTQFQKKNYEIAAAIFDDVLKQKREMPEAHMYLGISLYHLKNVDAAEASLRSAITMRDGETVALAHRFLGGIYLQKKKNSEAAAELQRYLELVPKAPDADRLKATIEDLKKRS